MVIITWKQGKVRGEELELSLLLANHARLTSAGILRSVIIMIDDVDHVENLLSQTVRSPSELARF